MLHNYLKIALRNLVKYKTYSFISIIGLTIGISCTLLILMWVHHELNYDKFHEKADEIYRVIQVGPDGKSSRSPAQLAPMLVDEIPEIDSFTRLVKLPTVPFQKGENIFNEDNGIVADPSFLTLFDFTLVRGDQKTALLDPSGIILSEELAKKYFGEADPINQSVIVNGKDEMTVTGVIDNRMDQSHIRFDFIMSFSLWEILSPGDIQNWGAFNYTTYLHLTDHANLPAVSEKVNQITGNRMPPFVKSFWEKFDLQPVTESHLSADIDNNHFLGNFTVVEDRATVYIFLTIAFLILSLACINFMNLATVRSATRCREVGIKKIVGSSKTQLVQQFMIEYLLLSVIAFIIAISLVELLLPIFNQLSGKHLVLHHTQNLIPYLVLIITITLLGGCYPAFYLSSFRPIRVLKGQLPGSPKMNSMLSGLVVFQFVISTVLIAGTLVTYDQLEFIRNKNLGFQKENIVYVPLGGITENKYETVKNALKNEPSVWKVTAKDCLPTHTLRNLVDFYWDDKEPDQQVLMELTGVDYDYFNTLEIEFAEGRSFSEDYTTDATNAFILNEAAVKTIGMESPVGNNFATYNKSGTIIGVIKNTNFKSLHQQVNPQVYHLMSDVGAEASTKGVMLLKIAGKNQTEALDEIEQTWKDVVPEIPFEYHFLDQTYDRLYAAEQKSRTLFNYFSLIAILIACLGLFGLTTHAAEKRRKEVGIRKTLGADISSILHMFISKYAKLVLIAAALASPIAYYVMNRWLQNFAYRIDLNILPFVLAGLTVLVIAMLTVSWQAIRAAKANPVESLKSE